MHSFISSSLSNLTEEGEVFRQLVKFGQEYRQNKAMLIVDAARNYINRMFQDISGMKILILDAATAVTNFLNDDVVSDIDLLRLVMLYALRYEKESAVQLMQLFNILACRSSKYKPGLVQFLLKQAGVDKRTGELYGNRDLMARMARELKGVRNVYTQHQPLLLQIMESITQGRLKDDDYPFVGNHFQQAGMQEVIIFIIGGTTYEESRFVAQQNALNPGIRFILGGSAILNSKRFLRDLEEAQGITRTSTIMV